MRKQWRFIEITLYNVATTQTALLSLKAAVCTAKQILMLLAGGELQKTV